MPCPVCNGKVEQNRLGSRIYCGPPCRLQAAYAMRKKRRTGRKPIDPRLAVLTLAAVVAGAAPAR